MLSTSRRVRCLVGLVAVATIGALPESMAQAPAAGARVDRYSDPLPAGAVLRLGTTRYRQDSPIYRIAYTPDGRHFLTDGRDSILRVWDAASGRIVRRIDPDVGVMADFAVSSRGHLVMAMGTTLEPGRGFVYRVTMTEIGTGRPVDVGSWTVDDALGFTVALCPDRQLVAAGMDKDGVRLLDAWTGAETARFATGGDEAHHIIFSRDGRRLAVVTWSRGDEAIHGELRVFDVDRKEELLVERLGSSSRWEPVFSPDGGTVAVSSTLNLDLFTPGKKEPVTLPNAMADQVCFTSDGRGLVGVARFGLIGVFDLEKRQKSASFRTGASLDGPIALAPDGRTLLTSGNELVLHDWDLGTRRDRFASPDAHDGPVTSVLVTPDGKTIITGAEDATMRLWDLATGRSGRVLRLSGPPKAVAISPSGQWLAVATSVFHQTFLWDIKRQGGPIVLATGRGDDIRVPTALHFLDDGKILMIDQTASLHEIDLKERRVRAGAKIELPPPALPPDLPAELMAPGFATLRLDAAAFLPGGKRVAISQALGHTAIADLPAGKVRFDAGGGSLVAPSPDGRLLAVAASFPGELSHGMRDAPLGGHRTGIDVEPRSGSIRLLDADTGNEQHAMTVEGSQVWAMAFSPDGKTLAATSGWESGQIHLYEIATGKETRTIDGPPFRSPALAFTPEGSRLVTGVADGSVLVWDLKAGR